MKIKKVIEELKLSSDESKGYFGFVEWRDDEFCIKANDDGLRLFAAEILEASEFNKEGHTQVLNAQEFKWFRDELGVNFIKRTLKTRSEIETNPDSTQKSKWESALLNCLYLVIGYLLIAGVVFTFERIVGS